MKPNWSFRLGVLLCVAAACGALLLLLLGENRRPDGVAPGRTESNTLPAAMARTPEITPVPGAPGNAPVAEDGRSVVPIEPPAPATMLHATGRLVDPSGRPVARCTVELQTDVIVVPIDSRVRVLGPDSNRFETQASTASRDDGSFVLPLQKGVLARIAPAGDEFVFRQGALDLEPVTDDQQLGDIVVLRGAVLAGVVRDRQGSPCRDVSMLCGRETPDFDESRARKSTTGDDGAFRFAGLESGRFRILCRSPRFVTTSRSFELLPEQVRSGLDIVLDAGLQISGIVIDDTSTPIADADVGAAAVAGGTTVRVRSGTDGRFVVGGLAEGDYDLTARANGFRSNRQKPTRVHAGARDLTVQLPRAVSIAGIVVDTAGLPVAGSKLFAVPANQPPAQDRQTRLFQTGVTTAADGRFVLAELGDGDYRVLAFGPHLDASVPKVHADAGQTVTDLRLVVDRGGIAEIRVHAPDGTPVAKAKVRVTDAAAPPRRPMVLMGGGTGIDPDDLELDRKIGRGVTDDRGIVVIAGLLPGAYFPAVTCIEFVQGRPASFSITGPSTVAVDVALTIGGFVSVEVVDTDGHRLPRKRVEFEGPLDREPPLTRGGDTDGDGQLRLGPLAAGRYAAAIGKTLDTDAFGGALLVTSGAGPTFAESRIEIEVRSGATTTAQLTCPALLTLRGTLRDALGPVPGGSIRIGRTDTDRTVGNTVFGLDGSTRSARTRADGSFAIADLEAGTWRVRYGKPKQEMPAEITLTLSAATAAVPLELVLSMGSLRVTASDAMDHHALAGARAILRPAGAGDSRMDRGILDYAFPEVRTIDETADAKGVARFDEVPFGSYVLELQASGHRSTVSAVVTVDRDQVDAGIVELRPGSRITGAFLDPDAGAPALACVEYRSVNETEFKTTHGSRGTFVVDGLESGDYVLRARRMGNIAGLGAPGPEARVHVGERETATADLHLTPE